MCFSLNTFVSSVRAIEEGESIEQNKQTIIVMNWRALLVILEKETRGKTKKIFSCKIVTKATQESMYHFYILLWH